MRDGVALLAILARVRRRLRALAALEGAIVAAAIALAAAAIGVAVIRWRGVSLSRAWRLEGLAALASIALGALAGALRRIPLDRCARFVDGALDSAGTRRDRVLSALAFTRTDETRATPFVRAAIADAVTRADSIEPRAAVPFRRPRATPALAAAAVLLGLCALSPLPARGSRVPARSAALAWPPSPNATRLRLPGAALDPERDEAAAALRASKDLRDTELAGVAQALAATVDDLANRGLDPGEALDRLGELMRRADQDAEELAGLPSALEQAGKALQATAATRESGAALAAQDEAATERALADLAERAAAAAEGERSRIASSLDRASERVQSLDEAKQSNGAPSSSQSAQTSSASNGSLGASAPTGDDDSSDEPAKRRLARDQPQASQASSSQSAAGPRERRLQRLQRELKETASACRTNPEACHRQLKRQSSELPRMEDEARSLQSRQRLAEAIRQLRERLRREGKSEGERGREERRFMRSARGENLRVRPANPGENGEKGGEVEVLTDDPDGLSDEGDDMESSDSDGESGQLADGDRSEGSQEQASASAARGADGQDNANGDGIGNQRGDDPLGARGSMITRGRAQEADVKDGAGPTRSQVIQSAAKRGFAHGGYQNVFTDYQAVVEESLDNSAVPPGRRYIVRRYFQLIRPQSSRTPPPTGAKR